MSALLLMVSLSGLAPVGAHAGLDAWQKNWRSLPAPEAIDSLPIQVLALIHPPVIVEDGFDGRLLFGRRMGPTEGVWMRTKDTLTVPDVPRAPVHGRCVTRGRAQSREHRAGLRHTNTNIIKTCTDTET